MMAQTDKHAFILASDHAKITSMMTSKRFTTLIQDPIAPKKRR